MKRTTKPSIDVPFFKMPKGAVPDKRDGLLKSFDVLLLTLILNQRYGNETCSGHHCTRERFAKELGTHPDTVYRCDAHA